MNIDSKKEQNDQFTIPVDIEIAFVEVFDKASCIHHWHNKGKNDEGTVVSSQAVYELWEVLSKYKDYRNYLLKPT
jgi:hypothetical protein